MGADTSYNSPEQVAAEMERELKYFGEAAKVSGLEAQ